MQFGDIKGFGEKRIQKLKEAGLNSPSDLIMLFPNKYVFRESKLSDFEEGETALVATCQSEPNFRYVRKGLSIGRAEFSDGTERFVCVWFNQPFVKRMLVIGKAYAIVGRLKRTKSGAELTVSSCSVYDGSSIMTIYRPFGGIPAKIIKEAILQVLSKVTIQGQISDGFCLSHGILPLNRCIKALHCPQNRCELESARTHAALQILAFNLAAFLQYKGKISQNKVIKYDNNRDALNKVKNSLPFELTEDQQLAIEKIVEDLHGNRRMNRLIEGDVGCGKTIVAFLAMYYAALSGYQAALMAPTEILARQHYKKAIEFFTPLGINCELLCGSQHKDRRAEALFNIETGNARIVIGTHSIFQESVIFKNLALAVADEQQRFGVEQRGSLENKGQGTDFLVMSATPIPRTIALTLYGELDVSLIRSIPSGKAEIFTKFVPKNKQNDMLDYLYSRSLEGEKSYIVCPRVDDEESISATKVYEYLKKKYGSTVGLVHGQMKDELKNEVMKQFEGDKIKLLVCTTVVEVGLDVPDAINIVIFDAESYGLSQLHQLRGRVGRSKKDSFCFVTSKDDKPSERLRYFLRTNNGFELAEYDFAIRGAGDFLGKRQHGNDTIFAGISINENMLDKAKKLSVELIENNEISGNLQSVDYIKGLTLN